MRRRKLRNILVAKLLGVCICLFAAQLVATEPDQDTASSLWSLQPLSKPAVPATASHPIDAFVDAKLAENGLKRSVDTGRRTWIRRLSFGLTGLPPSPRAVREFENDSGPEAYERLIDRLLASPCYGEHWARHWLDLAQYADTHGNDHDYARPNAWPYRDYVIRSLNADKPYARFVCEQVAGDTLYPESPEATTALGFLATARNAPISRATACLRAA